MIFNLLLENPLAAIVIFGIVVMAISVHEAAHAYTATLLGDDTPRLQGRLTVNPLKHLDPWGTLLIVIIGIGWGKPVQFNPHNLKNPRRDTAIIAVAGPISNVIMAVLAAILLYIPVVATVPFLIMILSYFVWLNIILALFNMLPINPLDGFKVVAGILPPGLVFQWEETRKYGMIVLIILMISGVLSRMLNPAVDLVVSVLLPAMTFSL